MQSFYYALKLNEVYILKWSKCQVEVELDQILGPILPASTMRSQKIEQYVDVDL